MKSVANAIDRARHFAPLQPHLATIRRGDYWRRLEPSVVTRVDLPYEGPSEGAMAEAGERAWHAPAGARGVIADRPATSARGYGNDDRRAS